MGELIFPNGQKRISTDDYNAAKIPCGRTTYVGAGTLSTMVLPCTEKGLCPWCYALNMHRVSNTQLPSKEPASNA